MGYTYWTRFVACFRFICWVAALILVVYWLYAFSRNADLCIVDYKKYYETELDFFPMLTICFKDEFSIKKMETNASGIDRTEYLSFLKGNYLSKEILDVAYENVVLDMDVVKKWIAWRNGSENYDFSIEREILKFSYAVFLHNSFFNCYTLQVPNDKRIKKFHVVLNASIFTFLKQPQTLDMLAGLHYPNQFLTSGKDIKYAWRDENERGYNENFAMVFNVHGIEVIQRRNKANRHCDENWKDYDRNLLNHLIQGVGCRAPYHTFDQKIGICSTKALMKKVEWNLGNYNHGRVIPCKAMTTISYEYFELNLLETSYSTKDQIWIGVNHLNDEFKEILQTRYDF